MTKEVLKHSKVFRKIFFKPLKWRQTWVNRHMTRQTTIYNQVVKDGTVIIRPKNLNFDFSVSATSDLAKRVILQGVYEPEMCAAIRLAWRGPGSVLNIGANIGFWAIGVIGILPDVEQVFAIEPNPEAFGFLRRNIVLNKLENKIVPLQICIADSEKKVELEYVVGMPEYSTIHEISFGDGMKDRKRFKVVVDAKPLSRITEIRRESIKLVIMDTEGAEYLILLGAKSWLQEVRPVIIFECWEPYLAKFGHSVGMIRRYFEEIGYKVRNVNSPSLGIPDGFQGEAIATPLKLADNQA